MDRFGVFIRSIGERTEALCTESVRNSVLEASVHVIQNVYPAQAAYEQMFAKAQECGYDVFLGLDADVILQADWLQIVSQKIKQLQDKQWFVFSFPMRDAFKGQVSQGNHFYNGAYVDEALSILKTKVAHSLRPESMIRHHVAAASPYFKDTELGWHGYEQYYRDIFFRFWLRAQRDFSWQRPWPTPGFAGSLIDETEMGVARAGYQTGRLAAYRKLLQQHDHALPASAGEREDLLRRHVPALLEKESLAKGVKEWYAEAQQRNERVHA